MLQIVSHREAEIVYDGPGAAVWSVAGKQQKNGQRTVRLSQLKRMANTRPEPPSLA